MTLDYAVSHRHILSRLVVHSLLIVLICANTYQSDIMYYLYMEIIKFHKYFTQGVLYMYLYVVH